MHAAMSYLFHSATCMSFCPFLYVLASLSLQFSLSCAFLIDLRLNHHLIYRTLATSSTTPPAQASLPSATMPEPTHPSFLSPPCTNTAPLSTRIPPSHTTTFSSVSKTPNSFPHGHPSTEGSNCNTDTSTPPTDDHQARVKVFRKQLQKLEEDVAEIKSLLEEREKALSGIRWEVEAQGDDMDEVEERSARTMRELRRLRRMNAR